MSQYLKLLIGEEIKTMEDRERAVFVALSYLGKPYTWGGDDPIAGFDCSGMCVRALKGGRRLPRKSDFTASGLYGNFSSQQLWNVERIDDGPGSARRPRISIDFRPGTSKPPGAGCLAFYGEAPIVGRIHHVEMMIDEHATVGASGGGRRTLTIEDAIKQNAFIKINPLLSRRDLVAIVDPFRAPALYQD